MSDPTYIEILGGTITGHNLAIEVRSGRYTETAALSDITGPGDGRNAVFLAGRSTCEFTASGWLTGAMERTSGTAVSVVLNMDGTRTITGSAYLRLIATPVADRDGGKAWVQFAGTFTGAVTYA